MTQTGGIARTASGRGHPAEDLHESTVADGFNPADLGAGEDAPPAYGEQFDKVQLSQAGFEAGAAVTDDGRVNININLKNRRLADLLAPTLRNQLLPEVKLPAGPLPPAYIPPSLGGQPGQTPPPRLNVVIQIVGSRGDVQPFVALGKVLMDTYGHRVRLATHPTFQKFVEENGLEFFSIGGDPAELMAFMVKNPGLMPGLDALKSGEIKKRREGIEEIVLGCWRSCIEAGKGLGPAPQQHKPDAPIDESFTLPGDPDARPFVADAIIANPPSFAHIHIAEKLGIPLHMMFTMPWSPTRAFPHPLANIQSSNTDVVMTNYVSYALVEMMTWQGLGDVINRFRTKILDLEPLSLIWAPGLLTRLRIPTTYCWSPALIPKPNDWMSEISISGFFFLNLASSYTPEPDLAAFLESGPPPVYIGFGSIVVDDPNALTRKIFDAVSATGVRALVSKGWGGLGADSVGIPDGVFMLGNCPHDWLFKRVSCVVHHGGAGTTAAGINCGVPTVVVPFFGDQPFWGAMIARAGAGPNPIPYKELTAENLATAIREALKPATQARAKELGQKIREEKGSDLGGKSFHEFLNTDSLRCSLAPSRVAVWRVRRTQIRLSTLAAAVLVKEGLVKYTDLKLYRSKEYHTEDQPWDPISAVTSALVGDISSIAMAIGDFPREMFKGSKSKKSGIPSNTPSTEDLPKDSSSTNDAASVATSGVTGSGHVLGQRSETASVSSTGPSLTVSGPEPSEQDSSTLVTSPDRTLSPNAGSRSPSRSRGSVTPHEDGEPGSAFNLETAIGAGKGVSRIVGTGMKSPMNFCMGLARGFRNAPRLYNDDTVRQTEKVTDFASGLRVAGKEFGLGFYDGISGLVTQPLKGAEKEGGAGFLKGFGKGIGGLILKPAAAVWSIPAYTMQGVHAEVRNLFSRSSQNYIITARVLQGQEDISSATPEEQKDILLRWTVRREELKPYYTMKLKERKQAEQPTGGEADAKEVDLAAGPPKTGWLHTRHLSIDERKKLHAQKEAWKRRQAATNAAGGDPSHGGPGAGSSALENEEFERAIRESVRQTSRGNADEDAQIERQIRASIKEMRRIAEQARDSKDPIPGTSGAPAELESSRVQQQPQRSQHQQPQPSVEDDDYMRNITDEEYQALIEEAVRQSLTQGGSGPVRHAVDGDDDEDLRRAIEESRVLARGGGGDDDDDEIQRALQESERAHRERQERDRTEEEKMLEEVKKQSMAEEERRRERAKGKSVVSQAGENEEDEDLKRALEESLKMSGGGQAGPSSSAGR